MDVPVSGENQSIWEEMLTANSGESLAAISNEQPVLLIFLRHFGCSFCREAISDLSKLKAKMESKGIRMVFVHMAPKSQTAEKYFKRYKMHPVDHISDPEKQYYRAFGLLRCSPAKLIGFMNWVRGFQAAVLEGHGATPENEEIGDGFQMPGVFVLYKGSILNSFVHRFPYDRPDYEEILDTCSI
ncbi:MAG: peroxiredoxin-like family protein [Saprospiraceae bacterium]|jgi:peroxiredoxin